MADKQTIRDIIHDLRDSCQVLKLQMTEPDEFIATNKIELAIDEAEKVFETTKDINGK